MTTLPGALARWSYLNYIKEVVPGREWHAECPLCGTSGHDWSKRNDDPDRFHMHMGGDAYGGPRGSCRRCGYFEWADDEGQPKDYYTFEELERKQKELELRKAQAESEQRRMRAKIEALRRESYWRGYHDGMSDWQREAWRNEGIPDVLQDRLVLGYLQSKRVYGDGDLVEVPAMSIPYFDPGWEVTNVQYRLIKPNGDEAYNFIDRDKYRFTSGLRAPMYLTDPDEEPGDSVILVEGAKKAIVVYKSLVLEGDNRDYTVVAVPSKMPNDYQLEFIKNATTVYVGLDPDAFEYMPDQDETYVDRAVSLVGRERARIVSWPDKPDDMVVDLGAKPNDMMAIVKQAVRP